MTRHKRTEVVVTWNPGSRRAVVLLDGQLAVRTRPAAPGNRISKGIAAEKLDLTWLEGAIRDMLAGALELRTAMTGDSQVRGGIAGAGGIAPRPGSRDGLQLDLWAPEKGSPGDTEGQLAGLACPLCGQAMILSVPPGNRGALLCPICARANYLNASGLLRLITAKMKEALDVTGPGATPEMRPMLAEGFDELKSLAEVLGELGEEP
jgi:hypothetical protein